MKPKTQSTSKKHKIVLVAGLSLMVLVTVLIFITIYGDKFNNSHKPGPQDSALAGELVRAQAAKINVSVPRLIDKSYDVGCESFAAGSFGSEKTQTSCTYRHIIVYTDINDLQAFLSQLRVSLISDGWQAKDKGENLYSKSGGPVLKIRYYSSSDLPEPYLEKTKIDWDISTTKSDNERSADLGQNYDKHWLEILNSVKQQLERSASMNVVVVDIYHIYFWDLY